MAKNWAEWSSEQGQLTKIRLPDGCEGRAIPMAAKFEYDRHGFEGYLGNVGLSVNKEHIMSDNGHGRTGHDKDLLREILCSVC